MSGMAKGNSKRKRAHKVSRGEVGTTKVRLTNIQKVLLWKGQYCSMRPIGERLR